MIDNSSPAHINPDALQQGSTAPGDEQEEFDAASSVRRYLIGLLLASVLSSVSFYLARSTLVTDD